MNNHKVKCANFEISNDKPFTLIAGPCQLENEAHAIKISTELKKITNELGGKGIFGVEFFIKDNNVIMIEYSDCDNNLAITI